MTDIVERLRAYRMDVDSPDVVYEAADEIERLRHPLAYRVFVDGRWLTIHPSDVVIVTQSSRPVS